MEKTLLLLITVILVSSPYSSFHHLGHTVPLSPILSCCLPLLLPSPVSVLLKQESEAQQVPPVTWQLYFGWGGFFLLFFSLGSFMIDIFIHPLLPKRSFILGFVILKTVLSFFFFSFVCLKWSFLKSSVHVGLCLPVSPLHSHGNGKTCLLPRLPSLLALSIWSSIWPFWEDSFFSTANEARLSCWHLPEVPS